MKVLVWLKKCLIFGIIQLNQNFDSNKLVVGKSTDERDSVAVEEFVGLKPKMHLFWVDCSEHKKGKVVKKNVVATISDSEQKDVLLKNNKCCDKEMCDKAVDAFLAKLKFLVDWFVTG